MAKSQQVASMLTMFIHSSLINWLFKMAALYSKFKHKAADAVAWLRGGQPAHGARAASASTFPLRYD